MVMHGRPLPRFDGRSGRAEFLPPTTHVECDLVECVLAARGIARLKFGPARRQMHRVYDIRAEPPVACRLQYSEPFPRAAGRRWWQQVPTSTGPIAAGVKIRFESVAFRSIDVNCQTPINRRIEKCFICYRHRVSSPVFECRGRYL